MVGTMEVVINIVKMVVVVLIALCTAD